LFVIIFLGGTAWAGYNYWRSEDFLEQREHFPDATPNTLDADKRRLDAMTNEVMVTSATRGGSTEMVSAVERTGRYAFADPTFFRPPPEDDEREREPIDITLPSVVVEMPPEIVLRAIMIMGKQRVAVMDIVGVGSGLMVRAGDTFMQKRGRVVQIAPDKVVLRWADHTFDIRPNF
jgi:hypothetical protein